MFRPHRLHAYGVFLALLLLSLAAGCGSRHQGSRAEGERALYGATSRIRGFDPVRASDVASARAVARVYETLLQYAYLDRPYRVVPLLAEGRPKV